MLLMDDPGEVDLALAKAKFADTAGQWLLSAREQAALLGLPSDAGDDDPLSGDLGVDAETRMRLAVQVAVELDRLLPQGAMLEWLRDDEDGAETPLAFMSRGATELRAIRAAAVARLAC